MNKSLTVFSGTLNAVFQAAEQFGVAQRDLLLAADLDEAMLRQADQRFPVSALYDVYAFAESANLSSESKELHEKFLIQNESEIIVYVENE